MLLIGCGLIRPIAMMAPDKEIQNDLDDKKINTIIETATAVPKTSSEPEKCQESFPIQELREPYQRYDDQPRYTLSKDEFQELLGLMHIDTICVPPQFGAPFINVDWNEDDLPATGRMVSIGFEELFKGGGWSTGYLLYSTYDFSVGSMYEIFSTSADYIQVQNETIPNPITIDGVNGFIRFHSGIPMGMQMIMKTYVFPFETEYVAIVIDIGAYDPDQVEDIVLAMEAGNHPDLVNENITLMDDLVNSIRFKK
jgi:hypothetical protein